MNICTCFCEKCGKSTIFSDNRGLINYVERLQKGPINTSVEYAFDADKESSGYESQGWSTPRNIKGYSFSRILTENYLMNKIAKNEGWGHDFCSYAYILTNNFKVEILNQGYDIYMDIGETKRLTVKYSADSLREAFISYPIVYRIGSATCSFCGSNQLSTLDISTDDMDTFPIKIQQIEEQYLSDNCRKEFEDILSEIESNLIVPTVVPSPETIDLTEYFSHVVDIEMGIEFFKRRLENTVLEMIKHRQLLKTAESSIVKNLEAEINEEEKKIAEERRNIEERYKLKESNYDIGKYLQNKGIREPQLPVAPIEPSIERPEEPLLQKANLFNKRKINEANELQLKIYQDKLDAYNRAQEIYLRQYEQYTRDQAKYAAASAEYKNEYTSAQEALSEKKQKDMQEYSEKKQIELSNIEERKTALDTKRQLLSNSEDLIKNTMEYDLNEICKEEVDDAKKVLLDLYSCREKLYAVDIIYPKYRELPALTSIYEYLKIGRCTVLEGHEGAYNLYESELRSDLIVSKLDTIIDSLEQIKQNQFLLYTELQSINQSIKSLERTMSDGLRDVESQMKKSNRFLENQGQELKAIKENTEMTAYYTQKTAEYTKRTMRLTSAIAFMTAIGID